VSLNSFPSIQKPWRLTYYGGMGTHFQKYRITTQNIHPLWKSNAIMGRGAQYGKVKMIYHLQAKSCEDGMGIHEHHERNIM